MRKRTAKRVQRTERRRRERQAEKAKRRAEKANRRDGAGSDPAGISEYEDCPLCRMMADPNATEAQVLRAFDEAEGQGGRVVRGDELTEWFQAINEQLEAEGHPTDIDAMTDDELTAHFQRVSEISDRLREDGMTTPFD